MATNFDSIPIVDLSLPRDQLVRDVKDACETAGFFYIKNHGVDEKMIERIFGHGEAFFALDEEKKMELINTQSNNFKGFQPSMHENVDPASRGDLHEAFDFGPEISGSDSEGKVNGNLWPKEDLVPKGFRKDVMSYFNDVVALGQTLLPLFALALGLPGDTFDDKMKEGNAMARLLYYPPQTGVQDDRVLGIGAHSDYELFTILRQGGDISALQVLNKQGVWIPAPPIPGTFVVNIADQICRWSNDIFPSTRHRAINRSGVARYSIPLFFGADYDSIVEPFPSLCSSDRPARYAPVKAGDYVKQRLSETYANSPIAAEPAAAPVEAET